MSYTICNVVCGVDLTDSRITYWMDDTGYEADALGLVNLYSGGGPTPLYCGVSIFEFDECMSLRVANMKLVPTKEQEAKATNLLQKARTNLEQAFVDLEKNGRERHAEEEKSLLACIPEKPDVVLVWSSS